MINSLINVPEDSLELHVTTKNFATKNFHETQCSSVLQKKVLHKGVASSEVRRGLVSTPAHAHRHEIFKKFAKAFSYTVCTFVHTHQYIQPDVIDHVTRQAGTWSQGTYVNVLESNYMVCVCVCACTCVCYRS